MERNTLTTVMKLQLGDRFYKATDKSKTVLQLIPHAPVQTKYQTYNYWCLADGERHPQAIKYNTQVIFLRHTTDYATANATKP